MSQEFENSGEENAEWQDPTKEVKEEEEFGAMRGIEKFLKGLPGGRYLLSASAIISLWGGSIEKSGADGKDWLSYKGGIGIMTPIVVAAEFNAGVTRKADGNYIIESKEKLPTADTIIGDLVYRSGKEISLPQDPEKFIKNDLAAFKKELNQACKDKKLAGILGSKMDSFANETFPQGLGKEGFVSVEGKSVKAQWAKFQDVELEVSEHMAEVQKEIYAIKDKSRASVTDIVLREYCDLIEDAAVINMARDQEK